jgi:hypothetical protein
MPSATLKLPKNVDPTGSFKNPHWKSGPAMTLFLESEVQ